MKSFSTLNPVFVDSTGRRHRAIRRAGAFLAVPATAYVILLVSSLVGGPTVNTPLIPLPAAPQGLSKPPVAVPTPVPAAEATIAVKTVEPSGTTPTQVPTKLPPPPLPVTLVTTAPGRPGQPTIPTVAPTSKPTATPTGLPTGTPTPTLASGHGKPTAPPGRTKSPSKP